MTFRRLILLYCLGLGVTWFVSTLQNSPGYMDADYYFVTGLRIAQGFGFNEPFLWNYLDNPLILPHPSHTYWMPLTSLLAALGIFISGNNHFSSAQIGFVVLTGFIPVLTASLSFQFNRDKALSTWAGILSIFSGYYLAFLPTTDTFVLYMLLGGGFFLVLNKISDIKYRSALLGIFAGMMHLARADGILWLLIAVFIAINEFRHSKNRIVLWVIITCAGYALIMLPWMLRNHSVFDTLLAPGGARALWFIAYDDLYAYPANVISFSRWWATGLSEIFRERLSALGQNLQTALAVQGEIFLVPLILTGAWRIRKNASVRWGVLAWLLTLGTMTFLFPFAGSRGGFFHAGAALQILMWALVPGGLQGFLDWGKSTRGWNHAQTAHIFQISIVAFAAILSLYLGFERIIGANLNCPAWNCPSERYASLDETLLELGAPADAIVMINNPPGYFASTGRPSIVIPDGNVETSLMVAERYQATYLLLEYNHPTGLDQLYTDPIDLPGLRYLLSDRDIHIFKIDLSP